MGISILGATSADPLRHPIVNFYKEAVRTAQNAGDLTYSSYTVNFTSLVVAKTLTINTNDFYFARPSIGVIFADTLVLNGTIHAAGFAGFNQTSNGVSEGGSGGGTVMIFARQIITSGSGKVNASGIAGITTGSAANVNGISMSSSPPYGDIYPMFGKDNYPQGNGNQAVNSYPAGGYKGLIPAVGNYQSLSITTAGSVLPYIYPDYLSETLPSYLINGGFGSSGASTSSTVSGYANAGAGGASIYANGGSGGDGGTTGGGGTGHYGTGGGGGGGGGFIYLMSENSVPNITLDVRGGNGADGYNSGGGGGGGGGGVVSIISPSTSANSLVSGGIGGARVAGYGAGAGESGTNGANLHTIMNLSG